jgi:hypothetical protein
LVCVTLSFPIGPYLTVVGKAGLSFSWQGRLRRSEGEGKVQGTQADRLDTAKRVTCSVLWKKTDTDE